MLYFKEIIWTVFLASVYGYPNESSAKVDNCTITSRCSRIQDNLYAIDGINCYLFRNPCLYGINVCQRRLENKPDLEVVTKEECQKYCKSNCTEEYSPVCGEYNNTMKTFGNKCIYYSESCQNDISYIFVQDGECSQY